MAKIVNKPSFLITEAQSLRQSDAIPKSNKRIITYSILAAVSLLLRPISFGFLILAVIFGIIALMGLKNSSHTLIDNAGKMEAGHKGEMKTLKVLERLNDEYTVVTDLMIYYNRNVSQLDSVIVGPNGVFIVETKNINGKVTGSYKDKNIVVSKDSSTKTYYNPIKQVTTHRDRLKGLLKQNHIDVDVNAAVFFVNEMSQVNMITDDIPVFTYSDDSGDKLLSYIKTFTGSVIDSEAKSMIVEILEKNIM